MQDYGKLQGEDFQMIKIDYHGYLNNQAVWAKNLTKLAEKEKNEKSRKLAKLAKGALVRAKSVRHITIHDAHTKH